MKRFHQQGQVLLITIMLLATVLAISFSLSFTSQTDTKVAKLEEQSKKALAAAEAIIESSLKKSAGVYSAEDLGLANLGFDGSATVSYVSSDTFVTPLLQKDEQYTFYASEYDPANNEFSNFSNANINIYLDSEANCPAVELTYIKKDNTIDKKELLDPCQKISTTSNTISVSPSENPINQTVFQYKKDAPVNLAGNYKLIIARVLFDKTKIGFKTILPNATLPPQGKVTTANAQVTGTTDTVSSTITLFQSYPQIPAEFFVTSF